MAFKDPSLFPVCQFVTLISGSPCWSGRAWKQMLPLRTQNVLGKEIQPNEMHEASLEFLGIPWNGILRSLGEGHSTCSREWGFAEESSLFYQKITP